MPSFKIDSTFYRFINDVKVAIKRHRSIADDLRGTLADIEKDYKAGDAIPGIGVHVRKIRVGCKKASIGKSKGYRLIYAVREDIGIITPLCFHYKPDIEMIPPNEILKLWKHAIDEHL